MSIIYSSNIIIVAYFRYVFSDIYFRYLFRFHHVCGHTCLCPHTFVPRHICDQTHLCPDMFVPRYVCAQTRLCPDMIVPSHDCAQSELCPDMIVPRHDCTQTHLCPDTFNLCPDMIVPGSLYPGTLVPQHKLLWPDTIMSLVNNNIIIVFTRLIMCQLDWWKHKHVQLLLAKRSVII